MTGQEREPRSGLLLLLCLLVVACVYAPALEGPFIWDDRHLVVDSTALRSSSLGDWFRRPFWLGAPGQMDSVAYYRPLTSLSLVLDAAIHGENSTGFHLTSLVVHLACTAALFTLLRRRGASPTFALLLTTCWALLPRLSEAVAWISGRGDALAALFTLAALLVYRRGSLGRLLGAGCLALCALLSKESGAAALVALACLQLGEPRVTRHEKWARGALLAAPLLVYGALRLSAGATALGGASSRPRDLSATLTLEALGRYVFMLVDCWQPRSLFGDVTRNSWPFVALGAASLLGFSFLAKRPRRAAPETIAAWALVLVPLVMVVHLAPLPVTVVVADRYLYLPAIGLFLAVTPVLQTKSGQWLWLSAAVLALAVSLGARTFDRARDYGDEARFWSEATEASPWATTGWVELGAVAYRAGLFEEGLRCSQRAIPLDRLGTGQALDNAALMAMASGNLKLAARLSDQLSQRFPRRPAYQLRRAVIALNARDFDAAERFGDIALRLAPGLSPAERLLRLVRESREAARRGAHPAVQQRLDAEALRYADVEASARRAMDEASPDKPLVAAAVEFMIAQGSPAAARALFQRYRERFGVGGTEAASAALEERARRAKQVHEAIAALERRLR
jgi:protein O-mannosyl-transferase